MNRGSPVREKLLLKLWNNLGIMGLFTKEQKPRSPHHLQFIMSSKDSDNPDKSQLAKNEAPKKKRQYRMAMTWSHTFNSGHRCKGSGRLPQIRTCEHQASVFSGPKPSGNGLKPTVKSEKSKLQVLFWKPQNQNKEAGNQRSLQKPDGMEVH